MDVGIVFSPSPLLSSSYPSIIKVLTAPVVHSQRRARAGRLADASLASWTKHRDWSGFGPTLRVQGLVLRVLRSGGVVRAALARGDISRLDSREGQLC